MNLQPVKFNKQDTPEFFKVLGQRVNGYFNQNNIKKQANTNMVVKTIVMILMYIVPYGFILSNQFNHPLVQVLLWSAMGMGMAGIGLSVMHDANHGAYSKNQKVNKALGSLLLLLGGHPLNWKIQHNVLHHTFTNIDGYDEDINPGKIMRFSPHKKHYFMHRLQHIYAWFFYGLMTLSWALNKDFLQLARYQRLGLLKQKKSHTRLWLELILGKLSYYVYIFVIPLVFTSLGFWEVLLYFFVMHFVAGLVLALIFQPAHVMESSKFPMPDNAGSVENSWAIHQLLTTTNFAPKSKLFSWYVGGLNYQIEHHLFPNICHVHYKKISGIVEKTAKEFGLPYHVQPTFVKAVWEHVKMLRFLGSGQPAA